MRQVWVTYALDIMNNVALVSHFFSLWSSIHNTALVLRLYDYMCVMSNIPAFNPSTNIKSKTIVGSSNGGLGSLT